MSSPALHGDREGCAMRVAAEIALSGKERRKLEKWASTRSTSVSLRERARIVLMAAQGMTNRAIAEELGVDANKVGRWRSRVAKEGMSSIEKERPRGANHGGKNSREQAELRSKVIEASTQTIPKDATHWSCRSMARHLGQLGGAVLRHSHAEADSSWCLYIGALFGEVPTRVLAQLQRKPPPFGQDKVCGGDCRKNPSGSGGVA